MDRYYIQWTTNALHWQRDDVYRDFWELQGFDAVIVWRYDSLDGKGY